MGKTIEETVREIMMDFPCKDCGGRKVNLYATGSTLCQGCGGTGKDRDRARRDEIERGRVADRRREVH